MQMSFIIITWLLLPLVLIHTPSSSAAEAKNILIIPLCGEGSHYFIMENIAHELANRGHNITILVSGAYEQHLLKSTNHDIFNFEYFSPNITQAEYREWLTNMTTAGLKGQFVEWVIEHLASNYKQREISECHNILGDAELLLNLKLQNFDVVLVDQIYECPIAQYLHKHNGTPFVAISSMALISTLFLLENRVPLNPSYMPVFDTDPKKKMSFRERLFNTYGAVLMRWFLSKTEKDYSALQLQYGISDMSFRYADAELRLINTHFALDNPRPLLPNTIAVGGLTTKPARSLNREWEDFLQSAGDDGVVLFSMGSYANGIDEDIAAIFTGAFAQLPQKVIWKLNGAPPATLTPNVKVTDWVPQNDVLAHPQIKAFVYHCGMNGLWEAVYHGVPVVAIPLYSDQGPNAQRIVARGMGVKVDIATLTSDKLARAIRTVINDKSYKENASKVSANFRDKPRDPPELAADWVEYVLRHGDAKHLRSAALDLSFFEYLLLDVMLFTLTAFIAVFILVICCCTLIARGCGKVCGSSSKVKKE